MPAEASEKPRGLRSRRRETGRGRLLGPQASGTHLCCVLHPPVSCHCSTFFVLFCFKIKAPSVSFS